MNDALFLAVALIAIGPSMLILILCGLLARDVQADVEISCHDDAQRAEAQSAEPLTRPPHV